MLSVKIHPVFDPFYYSFYIAGIESFFSKRNIQYTTAGFPQFSTYPLKHLNLILTSQAGAEIKVHIDASDLPSLLDEELEWCDIYAKSNVDRRAIPEGYAYKVIPIGPSFGIRLWNPPHMAALSIGRYIKYKKYIKRRRAYFAGYWRQLQYRLPISHFIPGQSLDNYIFFTGSFWRNEVKTNNFRANFIKACSTIPSIAFEGGFAPIQGEQSRNFEQISMPRRIPLSIYLSKLQKSAVAFNTPAVAGCFGWKLAEFLALGKAIISTPLIRELPSPLEHGVHIHYVDGDIVSIREAILEICDNIKYRRTLERNARQYFQDYLAPSKVVERIFHMAEHIYE